MQRRHIRRVRRPFGRLEATAAYVTALGLLIAALVASPTARADTQSDYEAAKARLASLTGQSDQLIDAYNAGAEKLDALNLEVEAAQERVRQLEERVDTQRVTLNSQAVAVYKYGSSQAAASLAGMFEVGDFEEFPKAQKYLGELQADTKAALEAYVAAKTDADTEKANLESAKTEQQKVVADLKAKQQRIEASVAEQERITTQFKEKLDAERAAAEAQARAAAERASRNGGGSGSGGGSSSSGDEDGDSGGGGGDPGPPSQGASSAVAFAVAQLGKPYRWGASGPDAYDCSGLTSAAWAHGGKSIPRTSSGQHGLPQVSDPAPGDIAWRPGHVALYVGGGTVISAPQTGDVVKYASAGRYSSFHRP